MSDLSPQEILAQVVEGSPFNEFVGFKVAEHNAETNTVTMTMDARPELMRMSGSDMFHGGPVAALIDTVGDCVVAISAGGPVPTINFRVDYLRPANGAQLRAVATLRKAGRMVGIVDVDVFSEDGKFCAVGRGCYSGRAG